ncbi:MAG TPA: DUF4292 domain-containing protein [Chitinophagaceae bacterium]|nr:DUF4292 domain-containing protein [Chitinophagaceae bacterium]
MRTILILTIFILALVSCKPTKKIQTAIIRKDTTEVTTSDHAKRDSMRFIKETYQAILANHIEYKTFSAKLNIDYIDVDDKKYNVNANLRMYKDSAIWISVNAIFGIEGLRALITKDSVKILDKQNKLYTRRSIEYLQEVSALPVDLSSLQELLIGNPVFLDSNIVSYSKFDNSVSLLSIGKIFKNLITINENKSLQRIKLDDVDELRNRTGDLSYGDYENKRGVNFSTTRKISFAEKKKLDIRLEFKQYNFNEELTFPFSIPKNYKTN